MRPLREDTTSQEVILGPFVDTNDGFTAETALTVATDDIRVWKHGASSFVDCTTNATHLEDGYYLCTLGTNETDTPGQLDLQVTVAGALPVRESFVVLDPDAFDSLVSGNGNGIVAHVTNSVTVGTNNDKTGYTVGTNNDKTGYSLAGSVTVGTNNDKTGYSLAGSVTVGTNDDKTGYVLETNGLDQVTIDEPSSVPAWGTVKVKEALGWLVAMARNKMTQTADTTTLRNDADSADLATSSVSDNGTTFTRGEWS